MVESGWLVLQNGVCPGELLVLEGLWFVELVRSVVWKNVRELAYAGIFLFILSIVFLSSHCLSLSLIVSSLSFPFVWYLSIVLFSSLFAISSVPYPRPRAYPAILSLFLSCLCPFLLDFLLIIALVAFFSLRLVFDHDTAFILSSSSYLDPYSTLCLPVSSSSISLVKRLIQSCSFSLFDARALHCLHLFAFYPFLNSQPRMHLAVLYQSRFFFSVLVHLSLVLRKCCVNFFLLLCFVL